MDISVVDLNRVEVYEVGASLITLLAYPREREEVWAQVHASLCSYALRIRSASEPINRTPAAAAAPSVIRGPGSDFIAPQPECAGRAH